MSFSAQQSASSHVIETAIRDGGEAASYQKVVDGWRGDDDAFRLFFIELLKACPFNCFRFEAPPATRDTIGRPFEFVLVNSPEIDVPANPRDFREHFDGCADDVLVFDNLGGDATMIVPRPGDGVPGYAHIAGFTHHAPMAQQLRFWKTVGATLHAALGDLPLWLNTAGGGVAWLHVRIDTRPKYYVFEPYRTWTG